jgi:alanyl-tRNA synthetase
LADIPGSNGRSKRIIADHIRGAVFLISEGILPSNVERGYILRRILRRAIRHGKLLDLQKNFMILLIPKIINIYKSAYPELGSKEKEILTVIQVEEEKFEKTLEAGEKIIDKLSKRELGKIGGKEIFDLYQSYGFPIEITIEDLKNRKVDFDEKELKKEFEEELKKHQDISRAGSEKKFVGGLADHSEKTVKYHTAAHLMLAALRKVLSPEVYQKGSNITAERLRFDFNCPQKMTSEQIKQVEDLVNENIMEDLYVNCEEMSLEEARKKGALGVFEEKYGDRVKVYSIGNFSKEICGGPHVKKTSELGKFKILKEESSGAGVRRIRAILE